MYMCVCVRACVRACVCVCATAVVVVVGGGLEESSRVFICKM